eukprot:g12831.t1
MSHPTAPDSTAPISAWGEAGWSELDNTPIVESLDFLLPGGPIVLNADATDSAEELVELAKKELKKIEEELDAIAKKIELEIEKCEGDEPAKTFGDYLFDNSFRKQRLNKEGMDKCEQYAHGDAVGIMKKECEELTELALALDEPGMQFVYYARQLMILVQINNPVTMPGWRCSQIVQLVFSKKQKFLRTRIGQLAFAWLRMSAIIGLPLNAVDFEEAMIKLAIRDPVFHMFLPQLSLFFLRIPARVKDIGQRTAINFKKDNSQEAILAWTNYVEKFELDPEGLVNYHNRRNTPSKKRGSAAGAVANARPNEASEQAPAQLHGKKSSPQRHAVEAPAPMQLPESGAPSAQQANTQSGKHPPPVQPQVKVIGRECQLMYDDEGQPSHLVEIIFYSDGSRDKNIRPPPPGAAKRPEAEADKNQSSLPKSARKKATTTAKKKAAAPPVGDAGKGEKPPLTKAASVGSHADILRHAGKSVVPVDHIRANKKASGAELVRTQDQHKLQTLVEASSQPVDSKAFPWMKLEQEKAEVRPRAGTDHLHHGSAALSSGLFSGSYSVTDEERKKARLKIKIAEQEILLEAVKNQRAEGLGSSSSNMRNLHEAKEEQKRLLRSADGGNPYASPAARSPDDKTDFVASPPQQPKGSPVQLGKSAPSVPDPRILAERAAQPLPPFVPNRQKIEYSFHNMALDKGLNEMSVAQLGVPDVPEPPSPRVWGSDSGFPKNLNPEPGFIFYQSFFRSFYGPIKGHSKVDKPPAKAPRVNAATAGGVTADFYLPRLKTAVEGVATTFQAVYERRNMKIVNIPEPSYLVIALPTVLAAKVSERRLFLDITIVVLAIAVMIVR